MSKLFTKYHFNDQLAGLNLGPLGLRWYSNRYGWGITFSVGRLSFDAAWDK
jgi:hypothetical protein